MINLWRNTVLLVLISACCQFQMLCYLNVFLVFACAERNVLYSTDTRPCSLQSIYMIIGTENFRCEQTPIYKLWS